MIVRGVALPPCDFPPPKVAPKDTCGVVGANLIEEVGAIVDLLVQQAVVVADILETRLYREKLLFRQVQRFNMR